MKRNGLKVGSGTRIYNETRDYGCYPELVRIGNNCVVTSGVRFLTNPAIRPFLPEKSGSPGSGIVVHDNCFLGISSIICPGVSIGPNAVVGAGAVVLSDVPPNMCVSGSPMRVNCTVDFYRSVCKKGVISNYAPVTKRNDLQEYFWRGTHDI